jgi:hypothetical protein
MLPEDPSCSRCTWPARPRRGRGRRRTYLVAACAAVAIAAIGIDACATGSGEPKPVPTLASTPQAALAFDEIRAAWNDPGHDGAGALRYLLDRFLSRFPADALVPLAHVYLALAAMRQGDFATADREIAASSLSVRAGTAQDLLTVARARRLRSLGQPEPGLSLLRPLVGKNVDPVTRSVFEEELTLTALATHRDYEAISYMDAWMRAASEEDRERVIGAVTGFVRSMPRDVLLGALQVMRTRPATGGGVMMGYGVEIEHILADALAHIATETGDVELARALLDPDAGAVIIGGDAGLALSELATSRRGLNVVEGRTLGLLLPTESPGLRDEAADVLRGVMWAMGLPRGLRDPSHSAGRGHPTVALAAPPPACAPGEPAEPLDDPSAGDSLRLVTRDDAGSSDRTEVSLDELAGDGAAVVVAGLDPQTAGRALRWGEAHAMPVLVLASPEEPGERRFYGFVLGEARENVMSALVRAAPSLAGGEVAPVIDESDLPLFPPQGGRVGPIQFLSPISCGIPATRAGDPRFPITQWEQGATRAWLVTGSPKCALDLIGELTPVRARGVVGLTLEAAALPSHPPGLRVVTASAGVVPAGNALADRDDDLRQFSTTLGTLSWWTALGRDAATLARVALNRLPADSAGEPHAVAERRSRARDGLLAARTRLWTTEATSWTSDRALKRTVCAVEVPAQ